MARRKKVEVIAPDPGDEVTLRGWNDEWLKVRVNKIGNSPIYGDTIEGSIVEDGIAHRHTSLPLSHLVMTARVRNARRGLWEVELPDGKIVRAKSKKAAQELCTQVGVVFQEV